MEENGELSPVRKWIIKQITDLLPYDTSVIRSDTNGASFQEWTGMTQAGLESIWIQEDTQRAVNNMATGKGESTSLLKFQKGAPTAVANAKAIFQKRQKTIAENSGGGVAVALPSLIKSVGTTTTCNAFLGVVVRKTLAAGGLAKRNFPSFDLPKAGGNAWTWNPSSDKSPKPGDFYQAGTRGGMYQHVGIIIDIKGTTWTTADSGQGGPSSGYDAIKRKLRESYVIMGWIDVDEFFKGWKGPGSV